MRFTIFILSLFTATVLAAPTQKMGECYTCFLIFNWDVSS